MLKQFMASMQKDDRPSTEEAVNSMTSAAKQRHEVAVARFNDTLCKLFDGPNCICVKPTAENNNSVGNS